ncbi:hypothetical protein CYLTODRAFT_224673 [Cylindrobasidium torrendii FP15055 ss-10]|uniref:BTB domain-containing protein n=1 Tax=Cylindrobasidium torrendii FP15055 ss-10 TaxID=1314674 RepID=A0A0D7BH67_9AGAR|nr:hypothetical protein CYLTODRAFT_224673 [Cylindrobasidium torrendii FP15055 ss-10]
MVSETFDDFSTNQHVVLSAAPTPDDLIRHPDLCFDDGNLAVLAGPYYFLVHQGLLARHSPVLHDALDKIACSSRRIEERPVFPIDDASPEHVYMFLCALYDGVSNVLCKGGKSAFDLVAGILRLATRYQVLHIRQDLLGGLAADWPDNLQDWDARESRAMDNNSVYRPRDVFPHPIAVINLCREISAAQLLPSALYDLSRAAPHAIVQDAVDKHLPEDVLLDVLKGREHASRFLSTFVVNYLEGRTPSPTCAYQTQGRPNSNQRTCQSTYEAITFELLRDVNGVVCQRSSDPLFAILEAKVMQSTLDRLPAGYRACKHCRSEFNGVVFRARADLWRHLPEWFGVELATWA